MGFLTRYDRELREPLLWRQGTQCDFIALYLSVPFHRPRCLPSEWRCPERGIFRGQEAP